MTTTITSISPDNPGNAIHSTLALRLDESFGTDAILRRLAECDEKYKDRR